MNDTKQQNDGGPAFPRPPFTPKDGHDQFAQAGFAATGHSGMSLRDWFAGMALQAIVSKSPSREVPIDETEHEESAARGAYGYADAMLAARKEAP